MKLTGIKKVCSLTKELNGYNGRVCIYLNAKTGRVFADRFYNQNSYNLYDSDDIIFVAAVKYYQTMEQIRELVCSAMFVRGLE